MEVQSLSDRSRSLLQNLAVEFAWPLATDGIAALAEAILPFLTESSSAQEIRTVASNYYWDGPMVMQMQQSNTVQGEQLWLEWRLYLLKVARQKQLSAEDAEDLVQTLYLHTRKALTTFKFNCRLKTYFHSIFNNQYLKWLQSKTKVEVIALDTASEYEPALFDTSSTDEVDTSELRQLISQEIQRLVSSVDFQILYWFYVEKTTVDPQSKQTQKWTDAAIGQVLGMPLNTVTARRTRALQRLQQNPRLRTWFTDLL